MDANKEEKTETEDMLALRVALDDMERGEQGRDFAEFADEFRQQNGLVDDR